MGSFFGIGLSGGGYLEEEKATSQIKVGSCILDLISSCAIHPSCYYTRPIHSNAGGVVTVPLKLASMEPDRFGIAEGPRSAVIAVQLANGHALSPDVVEFYGEGQINTLRAEYAHTTSHYIRITANHHDEAVRAATEEVIAGYRSVFWECAKLAVEDLIDR
ncbi:hypothetical protein NCC49_000788 [Naganishia albida]|nr:hypothetical protein NCC49_000788 [Naganishia albida]